MKKAQIRMTETIAVLIIFTFLLFMGYSWYVGIQQREYQAQLRDLRAKEAVQISLRTYFLPELHCSFGTRLETEGCIDKYKFEVLRDLMASPEVKDFYRYVFGSSKITLVQVYPDFPFIINIPSNPELILFDASIEGVSSRQTQMPVAIYDPIQRKYAFGYLVVDYYFQA